MNIFDSRNIPVAVTFGNHDSEAGPLSREEIMEYYNTFSCTISVDNNLNFKNCATLNIPVLASDSEDVKFNIWVFDSGDYDEDNPRHYDRVRTEQIEWYKETSAQLKAENGGESKIVITTNNRSYSRLVIDVLVCDGFIGNVALKTAEGTLNMFIHTLKKEIKGGGLRAKLGYLFMKKALKRFAFLRKYCTIYNNGKMPLCGMSSNKIKLSEFLRWD
jgi:hypothetical protein